MQFCDHWFPTHFYSTWLIHQHGRYKYRDVSIKNECRAAHAFSISPRWWAKPYNSQRTCSRKIKTRFSAKPKTTRCVIWQTRYRIVSVIMTLLLFSLTLLEPPNALLYTVADRFEVSIIFGWLRLECVLEWCSKALVVFNVVIASYSDVVRL